MNGSLFSESWFKVARLRAGLHGSVEMQKQIYRGETWYVVRSTFNDGHFRVSPETYDFIATLTPECTVEEHWNRFLERYGNLAPTQDEVISILGELYLNNLLYFRNLPDVSHVFERKSENKRKKLITTAFSIISIKIPLGNPDRLLSSLSSVWAVLVSPYAGILMLLVMLAGAREAVGNWSQITDATQGMLAPSNLAYMYAALVLMKLGHETAHAAVVKRFGGSVRAVGVMLLLLTPLPYVDASDSWFFQERRQRLLVSAAGMLFDLFAAALATLVWSATGDGVVHSVAFNIMILGSVSSVFFNGNPLLRYDAYYLLADVLEIPNLYERSKKQWLYYAERYLLKVSLDDSPASSARETFWLASYGGFSFAYRCFLSVVILLVVADRLFVLGMALAVITLVVAVILPGWRFIQYLNDSPRLTGVRGRAVAVALGIACLVVVLVGLLPMPRTIYAPGVIEKSGYRKIYADTEGRLDRIYPENGSFVKKGDVIASLSNNDLERDIDVTTARMIQTAVMRQKAMLEAVSDLKPIEERRLLLEKQMEQLKHRKNNLRVVADVDGVFSMPPMEWQQGRWLKRQTQLGTLVGAGGETRFSAIVSQEQAFDLFKSAHYRGVARLYGSAGIPLQLTDLKINPYQREELPSAALGWYGGGDVAVSTADKTGRTTTEAFYEVSGRLDSPQTTSGLQLLHGRSGVLRLSLPSEPLARMAERKLRQLLQKRYKL